MEYRIGRTVIEVNNRVQYDSRETLERLGFRIVSSVRPKHIRTGEPTGEAYAYMTIVPQGWNVSNQGDYHTKFTSPDGRTVIWSFIKNDPWDVQGWIQITVAKEDR